MKQNNSQKHSMINRLLLGLGTIFLLLACLGGGLAFLGYLRVGKYLVGTGIVLGNLCIVTFWVLKLLRKTKKGTDRVEPNRGVHV